MKTLTENALKVLEARYLLRDSQGKIAETPEQLFERVATAVASAEKSEEDKALWAKIFSELMTNLDFLPNTPTLVNAGNPRGSSVLSACFVLPVKDSLDSIFNTLHRTAMLHQGGAGTGYSFSELRPANSIVSSRAGVSSGPISFMRVYNAAVEEIKQGGVRRGAQMNSLSCSHPDILAFIRCKRDLSQITNANISIEISDAFMEAVENDSDWVLSHPKSATTSTVKAKDLWNEIIESAWQTGDPGCLFLDEANRHNSTPHIGKLATTNPCIAEGELISTARGWIPIEEVTTSDKVVTQNGLRAVTGTYFKGIKSIVTVSTVQGYTVRSTPDHRFLTTAGWKEAHTLTKDDSLILQSDDITAYPSKKSNTKRYRRLGQLYGDGWVSSDNSHAGITFGLDKGQALIFAKEVGANVITTSKHRSGNSQYVINSTLKTPTLLTDAFFAKREALEALNTATREEIVSFIEGWWLADGHIEKANGMIALAWTSADKAAASQLQRLLIGLGVRSSLYKVKRTGHITDIKYNFKQGAHSYRVSVSSNGRDKLVKLSSLFAKELKGLVKEHYNKAHVAKVSRVISETAKKKVYDISVEADHSFSVNGIIVHNCGEIFLLPNEACNLGSINLVNFVINDKVDETGRKVFDWGRFKSVIHSSVRFLDNVIEISNLPFADMNDMMHNNRKIGLGVMGWADLLLMLEIAYDSEEALQLAEVVGSFLNEEAKRASAALGQLKGNFPNYTGSIYDQPETPYMRNCDRTCVAPTGSISIIANETSSGIEPVFAFNYTSNRIDTKLSHGHWFSKRWAAEHPGEALPAYCVEANRVMPSWHVRMQSVWQKNINLSISKTVNLPNSATREDISNIYMQAWKLRCKGITVYRDGCRATGQVLDNVVEASSTVPEKAFGNPSRYYELKTGSGPLHVHIDSKRLFINMPPIGTEISGMASILGVVVSKYLELGGDLKNLIKHFQSVTGDKPVGFGPNKIQSIPHALSIIFKNFLKTEDSSAEVDVAPIVVETPTCPECFSHNFKKQEGCNLCGDCGFSSCS